MKTDLPSDRRAWMILAACLALLTLGAISLVQQQTTANLASAQDAAQREIHLLATLIGTDLQDGNYQYLEDKLREWGKRDPEVAALSVTAANGFVLATYRRARAANEVMTQTLDIHYSYQAKATLALTHDLDNIAQLRDRLILQLAGALVLLAGLLGFLLYTLLARQREAAALRVRTRELDESNAVLQAEIHRRQQSEESLFDAKERAEVTLHSIGDAVITTNARGEVDYLNPVAAQLTGWTSAEARGKPLLIVFPIINELTRLPVDTPVERVLREGRVVGLANHTVLISRDGSEIAVEDSAAPILNRAGEITGVVLVFHDVTQSRKLTNQISWQASHDALTGLINRREFENRLSHALGMTRSTGQQHVLLYLDLDQFKVVNDTCGHVAGDELLRQLSHNMQNHLRASDTLGRLGGDEFGVLLENCPLDHALQIAETLRAATTDYRFNWEKRQFGIGVSIGVVPIHHTSGSVDSLFAAADMACYAAKESGRNRTHVYRESDTELRQRHGEMLWVSHLTEALKNDDLLLYRQAIVPISGRSDTLFEVLVRLYGEQGDLILPEVFLPAAERYNLMPQVDRWVVAQTISRLRERRDVDNGCTTAINLSGSSLGDERFLDFVRAELKRDPAITCRLCFEITETAAIGNLLRAAEFMSEMHNLGCRFALDDFGTGLSSFGYLKNLPVDYLKIDGSLVRGIVDSETDFAMVEAINNIGHTLGIQTIAEYVENDAILSRLVGIHVDYAQGYGIAIPEVFPATR